MPIGWQHRVLCQKIRGHYAYYGIIGNSGGLNSFYWEVRHAWREWLSRRSRAGHIRWDRYTEMLERMPLPEPRIIHAI